MHLAINGSDLGRQRGGNESYLRGLLDGLATLTVGADLQVSLVVTSQGARTLETEPQWRSFHLVDVGAYRRLTFLLWQQTAALRPLRPDWLLSTFFLPPVVPCRAAVLIHDLSFRAHPEFFPPTIAAYMRVLSGLAIRRADAVIALSKFTRAELLRFYPAAQSKTSVVYPGVGTEFSAERDPDADDRILATRGVRRPYLLAVGNIHPRKNLSRLLDAWERLRDSGLPVPTMVWAGLGRWASGPLLEQARVAGVKRLGFVDPADLPALYRRAQALVYPSLYEGFGLPPLEAMACGTPVLAANTSSLPEAVGDAAVTVDPTSADAVAEGLKQVLFDEDLRRELRARGFVRAARFRWERTATQLLDALSSSASQQARASRNV